MLNNLLSKVPFVGTAVSFVTGNIRLVIEYVLIALVIACAASALTLWYRTNALEGKNETLIDRVSKVEGINEQQDATIVTLRDLRERDGKVINALVKDFDEILGSDTLRRKELRELETKDENVRAYLDQPLPSSLACLLNHTCGSQGGDKDRAGKAAGGTAGSVQSPAKSSNPNHP